MSEPVAPTTSSSSVSRELDPNIVGPCRFCHDVITVGDSHIARRVKGQQLLACKPCRGFDLAEFKQKHLVEDDEDE